MSLPRRALLLLLAVVSATALLPGAACASPRPPVNSGRPHSLCAGVVDDGPGPAAGMDTTSLGAAPAPYELGRPTGLLAAVLGVQRVMILVHGGGWYTVGPGAVDTLRDTAAQWRSAGWATVDADYRPCAASLDDVVALYDLVRARYGASVPICLQGQSAGAQLALMVAARRPDVACVVAAGAPTDLWTLKAQARAAVAAGAPPVLVDGASWVRGLARAAFGRAGLRDESPATWAASIRARVLLAAADDDPLIPPQQADELADALRAASPGAVVDVVRLAAGTERWVHGKVAPSALDDLQQRVSAFVAPFGRGPSSSPFPAGSWSPSRFFFRT